ncbi:hypothetical protein Hanom_Chr11g01018861 [Helianthus anomalus]
MQLKKLQYRIFKNLQGMFSELHHVNYLPLHQQLQLYHPSFHLHKNTWSTHRISF